MIPQFLAALLLVTMVAGVCTLISVGLEAILGFVWKRTFGAEAPVDFQVILANLAALLIAIGGVWAIPKFQALFDSFGADLPWPTRLVLQYRYVLVLPLAAMVLLHFRPRRPDGGRPYVPYVLLGEFALSVLVLTCMYLPVFSFREAVQ